MLELDNEKLSINFIHGKPILYVYILINQAQLSDHLNAKIKPLIRQSTSNIQKIEQIEAIIAPNKKFSAFFNNVNF